MHYYYDAMVEMIKLGGFDILGHADLIKKNCHDKNYWHEEIETCRQREIARACADAKITVEINTGGINRGKISDTYPSLSFLRLFREYNVPVTITADAHNAKDVKGNFDTALQTLAYAGFTEHTIFFKNNNKILWQKEKI
jgi:histidinol-phosphatase (PHP family)